MNHKASLRANCFNFHLPAALMVFGLLSAATVFADEAKPHWSYSGPTGPEHWATEDAAYATCGIGKTQSPIDIEKTTKQDLPPLEFNYQPNPLRVTDTGHSIQINYQAGSALVVDGRRYELIQFHFHKPSEESVHGRHHAMVAHLVHMNDQGELAVVAVLMQRGKANAFLKPIFDNFPAAGSTESTVAGQTLNVAELLPASHGYFAFDGSLTTPPCSEHVRWFVLKDTVELSAAQIGQFAGRYPMNARPVQPLNGRVVLESSH